MQSMYVPASRAVHLPGAQHYSSLRCMLGLSDGQQVIKGVLEPAFLLFQRNI